MSTLRFVCVYIDLMNPAIKFKAIIDADYFQIEETESEGGNFLAFYKKDVHKKDTSSLVFTVHEGRVIHAYAEDYALIREIEKGKTGMKSSIKLVKSVE